MSKAAQFDQSSGIRERLALLAEVGPEQDFNYWGYHPSRDFWYAHGQLARRQFEVKQEGSASLDLIRTRWGMERSTAMAFIGYPEVHRTVRVEEL